MNLTSIIAFILVFGIIVAVHELGHLIAAKKFGAVVYQYAIGFGPKIFGWVKNGTSYAIRIIPVGGYVLIAGSSTDEGVDSLREGQQVKLSIDENLVSTIDASESPAKADQTVIRIKNVDLDQLKISGLDANEELLSFSISPNADIVLEDGQSLRIAPPEKQLRNLAQWKQIIINLAGPLMNFVLAIVLFFALAFAAPSVPNNSSQIGTLTKNYPAQKAGLKSGDVIEKLNDRKVKTWAQVSSYLATYDKKQIKVQYKRANVVDTKTITLKKSEGRYFLGITQSNDTDLKSRISYSYQSFINASTSIWLALGNLIVHPNINDLGGPVAIAKVTSQATQGGFWSVVSLTAFLSINIGIFNLIPLPVFDGGHILINIIQAIRRKPLSDKTNTIIQAIGAGIVIVLLVAVTINDVMRK
ncbi:MAG: RIP metalloprotease RseP [Lactobacillaceae bacterium]|jgi:regulator of sigma E protease|nr:RIP metalloprotease RseP [Lactobacillaceae bacterium]